MRSSKVKIDSTNTTGKTTSYLPAPFSIFVQIVSFLLIASNMTSNNNTMDHSEDKQSDSTNTTDIVFFILGATVALSGMIILNTQLTNLNRIMKTILNVLFAHTLWAFIILAIILGSSGRNEFTCGFMTVIVKSLCYIVFDHFALISCVRFHLVVKSAENESPNESFVIGLMSLIYFVDYFINILLTTLTDTIYEDYCLNDPSENRDSIEFLIHGMSSVIVICVGLYYDDKYIGLLRTNNQQSAKEGHQELPIVIPVKASWVSLATSSFLIITTAIFAPEGRITTFSTFNVLVFLFPTVILMTILAITYNELRKPSQQSEDQDDGEDVEVQDPQSYVHLCQVRNERRRIERNSVTEDIFEQQLLEACEVLTVDKIFEHTVAQEAQPFGIKDISAKKTMESVQLNMDNSIEEQQDGQKPKSRKVKVQVEAHEELPGTRIKSRFQTQQNLRKHRSQAISRQRNSNEENAINIIDQTDDELIEQEMALFNLTDKEKSRIYSKDCLENETVLDEIIAEELEYYNLSKGKPVGKIHDEEEDTNSWDAISNDLNKTSGVILNPKTLQENEQRDERRVSSFCKSLDSDIFEILADLEGMLPLKYKFDFWKFIQLEY